MTTAKLTALFGMLMEQAGLIDKPGIGFGMHFQAGNPLPTSGFRVLRITCQHGEQIINVQEAFTGETLANHDNVVMMRIQVMIQDLIRAVFKADQEAQRPKLITDPLAFGGPINPGHS